MRAHIDYQTISQDGRPAFVVIPYEQFSRAFPEYLEKTTIPNEVVKLMVDQDVSRLRAWREYLGLTQEDVAKRMEITQAALSQMEALNAKPRKVTLEKLAKALGLSIEQLR